MKNMKTIQDRLRILGRSDAIRRKKSNSPKHSLLTNGGSFMPGRIVRSICLVLLLCFLATAAEPAWAVLPTPNQPILVVEDFYSTDKYLDYVPELLRTEGLNGLNFAQLSELTAAFLSNYDAIVLPHVTLTTAQATMFQNYVNAGGTLVAFRPDLKLANVFGVTSLGTTLAEGWLKINTATPYTTALEA